MENQVKKFNFKTLFSILLALICIILVVFVIFFKVNNFKILSVQSGSMSPTIKAGDILLVKAEDAYTENDIIAFNKNGVIITHRIREIKQEKGGVLYVCAGDNAKSYQIVSPGEILGKMCFVFGKNVKILFKILPFATIFIIILLFLMLKKQKIN